ncbi:MAG: aminopeptidase P family protein [Acidobacteria bacterium]|nr:aminopeptidase P family protein [Acidobacteriota bacterium]
MNYSSRQKNIAQALDEPRLDALLITHLPNVRYLCGFTGSSGVLAFARGEWAFFTDGRYTEQARQQVKSAQIIVDASAPLVQAARWIASRFRQTNRRVQLGVEGEHLTLAMQKRVQAEIGGSKSKARFRLVSTADLVEKFRMRKDHEEISAIRKAVQLASGIFPAVIDAMDSRATENEIAAELEHFARRAGAEKMSFETIVAAGPHSAMPHARPTHKRVGSGFVVLDYGVILGGYCSDMTRTVHAGRMSKNARDLYSAVLAAQLAGISAVRAGVQAGQVDRAAREVLARHKLDQYFTHSLGHGVGLEIHEAPRLAKGQTTVLEKGMVVTIEPGAYIPGSGGVRIEDMVLVTANGCEVLTPTPKELVTC